jgi:uncharacterized membrane protein YfhO
VRSGRSGGYRLDRRAAAQATPGLVHCDEFTSRNTNAVARNEKGYRGEQYMNGPGAVKLLGWTPNRLTYEVNAPARSLLVINQNYAPGWHLAGGGGQVISSGGLLAVSVGRGNRELTLVYRGWPFEVGLAVSILTWLAAIAIMLT